MRPPLYRTQQHLYFVELELLDVGGGLVWQTNAGVGYQFQAPFNLIASLGRIEAVKGNFKANVVSLSLGYQLSFFAR